MKAEAGVWTGVQGKTVHRADVVVLELCFEDVCGDECGGL